MRRLLGLINLLDGVVSAGFGHEFMRSLIEVLPSPLNKIPAFFLRVPEPLFRIGAVIQAILGWEIMTH